MNRKGDLTGVLFWIVSISAFAIFLLIVGYIVPQISDPLQDQIGISGEINNSFSKSVGIVENTFPTIWLIFFVTLMLGLFVTAYFVPTHPIFVPVFIILLLVTVLVSVALSNTYDSLSDNATLADASLQQQAIEFIMTNLPFVALVVGVLVMVISFAKPNIGGGSSFVPV